MKRLSIEERARLFDEICDSIYIESCHMSGCHDPKHTTKYICDAQLAKVAKRVLKIIFDIEDFRDIDQINRIPRRVDKFWGKYDEKRLKEWQEKGFQRRS